MTELTKIRRLDDWRANAWLYRSDDRVTLQNHFSDGEEVFPLGDQSSTSEYWIVSNAVLGITDRLDETRAWLGGQPSPIDETKIFPATEDGEMLGDDAVVVVMPHDTEAAIEEFKERSGTEEHLSGDDDSE